MHNTMTHSHPRLANDPILLSDAADASTVRELFDCETIPSSRALACYDTVSAVFLTNLSRSVEFTFSS